MQYNDDAGEFALLTRQEVAYLSDGLPHLTNAQKSKLNYKTKKKLQIFEKVELPLLMKSGFELGSISLSVENNKDCHSLDPGSKFGLEKNRTNIPARALTIIFTVSQIQMLKNYNKKRQIEALRARRDLDNFI
jgi:hypothetical protein